MVAYKQFRRDFEKMNAYSPIAERWLDFFHDALEAEREARKKLQEQIETRVEADHSSHYGCIKCFNDRQVYRDLAEKAEASLALHQQTLDAEAGLLRQKIEILESSMEHEVQCQVKFMMKIAELEADLARHRRCLEAKGKALGLWQENFERNLASENFLGDDDHKAYKKSAEAMALKPEDFK